jgi:hypothetical protein
VTCSSSHSDTPQWRRIKKGNQWVLWIQVEPTRSRKHIAGTPGGPPEAKVSLAMGLGYQATEETKAATTAAKRSGSSLKG